VKLSKDTPVNIAKLPYWTEPIDKDDLPRGWVFEEIHSISEVQSGGMQTVKTWIRINPTHAKLSEYPWEGEQQEPVLVGWEGGRVSPVTVAVTAGPGLTAADVTMESVLRWIIKDLTPAIDRALG
jgi:hypothetical protein